MRRIVAVAIFLVVVPLLGAAKKEGAIPESGVVEEVEVVRTQLEAVVWPDNGKPALCDALTAADFELRLNGSKKEAMVDFIGRESATLPATATDLRRLVILFDEELLGVCPKNTTDICPRARAYDQARKTVETLKPGEQIMLATFYNEPAIHTGWLEADEREETLRALDELEATEFYLRPRPPRLTSRYFWDGVMYLLESLGTYAGHKDLFLLSTDYSIGPNDQDGLRKLGVAAQASRVTVYPIDIISDLRASVIPDGLVTFAEAAGGKVFSNGATAASALAHLREIAGCRVLFTFEVTKEEAKHRLQSRVVIRKPGFRVEAPTGIRDPFKDERDELERLFLLPRWGDGFVLETGLFPIRPAKDGTWDAVLVAKIARTTDALAREDIEGITINATIWKESAGSQRPVIFRNFTEDIVDSDEIERFLANRESFITLLVPGVWPQPVKTIVSVRAVHGRRSSGASLRRAFELPPIPQDGAGVWFLVTAGMKHEVPLEEALEQTLPRINGTTLIPSLSGIVGFGKPAFVMAYGCFNEGSTVAKLGREGGEELSALVERTSLESCGYYAVDLDGILTPGTWHFTAPKEKEPSLSFVVVGHVETVGETTPPTQLTPQAAESTTTAHGD